MSSATPGIRELPMASCCELVALPAATPQHFDTGWPLAPGAVRSDSDGRAELLHFAPGRWLMPDPQPQLLAQLQRQGVTTLYDVEGKWRRCVLVGPAAARALGASISVESVLAGRECAAVTLFDCPAVLRRAGGEFELWTLSSYLEAFKRALQAAQGAQSASAP